MCAAFIYIRYSSLTLVCFFALQSNGRRSRDDCFNLVSPTTLPSNPWRCNVETLNELCWVRQVDADEWQQTVEEGEGAKGAKEAVKGGGGTKAGSTGGVGVTRAIRFKTPLHVRDLTAQLLCIDRWPVLCCSGSEST